MITPEMWAMQEQKNALENQILDTVSKPPVVQPDPRWLRRLKHPITIYKFWRLFRAYGEPNPLELARKYAAIYW